MADCNVSIDQNKLPGVKEVCRDFAVLEDHSLAYNLQEQEIESHLASNVHKNRLVQKDLLVAKKLQEEEDEIAKTKNQNQHVNIEDVELAHDMQEELLRQEELQRLQEEKDAAIARKLQEREMKEERRRQKQLESNLEEEYFEDRGAARPLDLDRDTRQISGSRQRAHTYSPERSGRAYSPDYYSAEPKRSRYPKTDSAAPQSRSRNPEHYLAAEGGRSKHADPYPEHLLPPRDKHEDRYPEYEAANTRKAKNYRGTETDGVVKRKERPERPPPPQNLVERDKETYKNEREGRRERDNQRVRDQNLRPSRELEKSRSGDRSWERDRQRQKDRDKRARSRDGGLEIDLSDPAHWDWLRERSASRDEVELPGEKRERRAQSRPRVYSIPSEMTGKLRGDEEQKDVRETLIPGPREGHGRERSFSTPVKETGRIVHRGSGSVVGETELGVSEATKGLTKLDLREQELKDLEVAKKLQQEELKASSMHVRAAQVAQDEEIARLLMEKEKKEYRKNREREKEKERERERLAMERRRQEGEYKPKPEEVVRPRTRDEYDHQRQRNQSKPVRPPQPHIHDYENVSASYSYSDHPIYSRPHARPEASSRGAYAYQKR